MVEGSLWVYGHTRLADFYEDRLSLRELYNRLRCLPPAAPLWDVLHEEHEKAAAQRKVDEVEETLARLKP